MTVGDGGATGVVLRDQIPEHSTVVAGSVTATAGAIVSEDPVEVTIGDLLPGVVASVTFEVEVDNPIASGVMDLVNQGVVLSDQLPFVLTDDHDLGGTSDPTETMIVAMPDLVAEKTASLAVAADGDGVPSPGDTLEYEVRLLNNGNTSATGVGFADVTPEHTAIVAGSVTADRGTVESEDPVAVTVGEIAGGMDSVTLRFQVVIDSPIAAGVLEVVNQGLVLSDQLDDVLTDDPGVGGDADPASTRTMGFRRTMPMMIFLG